MPAAALKSGLTLGEFRLDTPRRVAFRLSAEQVKLLDDLFALHGNTVAGRGQALKLVPVNKLWRQPVAVHAG